ncbi:DUF1905 domain-containing protein [Limibacter armeniacum]|uniref:DUF1905 domain-containing protein n=1 Tax=Limibacter armeniacum TaxID=466084 RepID=UPI002FE6C181
MTSVTFETPIQLLSASSGIYYLEVPQKIINVFSENSCHNLLCTINEVLTYCSVLMQTEDGRGYVGISTTRMEGLGVKLGDTVVLTLKEEISPYGTDMPEELGLLLCHDEEGARRFSKLTEGKQRSIIVYVAGVQSPLLRKDRALKVIENLKQLTEGKETFKQLLLK